MTDHAGFGWMRVILGRVIAWVGLVWVFAPSIPWLGRLLGDIRIERENFRSCFPLVTCLLVRVVLSLVVWLIRVFWRAARIAHPPRFAASTEYVGSASSHFTSPDGP
jgi:hypothetical protein